MKQLILFNGPPRSGKDTAADHLWANIPNAHRIRMSGPIKAALRSMFALEDIQVSDLEANKETPHEALFNRSYRDAQISFSEHWAKEYFGPHVFGKLAARRIAKSPANTFLCSDSGFDFEAEPLIKLIGKANVLLVRLHRAGKDFTNDSRSYIYFNDPDITELDMQNNGSVVDFHKQLDAVVGAWLQR